MPDLSIKKVPESVVARLRARAAANHRSLQGELMALVCRAANDDAHDGSSGPQHPAEQLEWESGWMTVEEIAARNRANPIPGAKDLPQGVDIIRRERDAR